MNILEVEKELKTLKSEEISLKEKLRLDNVERLDLFGKKRKLLIELFDLKTNSDFLKEEIQKINWKLYYTKHNITDPYRMGNYEFFNLYFEAESIKNSFFESLIKVLFLNKSNSYRNFNDFESDLQSWEITNPFSKEIEFGYCYMPYNQNVKCIGIPLRDSKTLINFVEKFQLKIDLSLFSSQITDLQLIIESIRDMDKKLENFKK